MSKKESAFDWVKIPKELERKYIVKVIAKTPNPTDHRQDMTIPPAERVIRNYSPEELKEAARSLAFRHIDINHNLTKIIPNAFVIDAQWNEDKIEAVCYIPSDEWLSKLRKGEVKGVSIEEYNREDVPIGPNAVDVKGITFIGLALVTEPYRAGDQNTSISPMFEAMKDCIMFEISGVEFPEIKGEPMGQFSSWDDCIAWAQGQPDIDDPEAYCGYIKSQTEIGKTKEEILETLKTMTFKKVESAPKPADPPAIPPEVAKPPEKKPEERIAELETAIQTAVTAMADYKKTVDTQIEEAKKEAKREVVKELEKIPDIRIKGMAGQRMIETLKQVIKDTKKEVGS